MIVCAMRLRACVFVRLFVCGAGRVQSTDMCVAQAERNRLTCVWHRQSAID